MASRKSRKRQLKQQAEPPRRRRRWIVDVALSLVFGVLVGMVVVYLLLGSTPEGFVEQPAVDAAAVKSAYRSFTDKVLRLVEGLNNSGVGRGVFTEEELTAVLQAVEHPELVRNMPVWFEWLKLPDSLQGRITALQLRITPGHLQLACRYRQPWLNSPVIVLQVDPKVVDGRLVPQASMWAGKLTIRQVHYRQLIEQLARRWLTFDGKEGVDITELTLQDGELTLELTRRR